MFFRMASPLALAILLAPRASGAQNPAQSLPQIIVSASGEGRVVPDRATISFAVESRAQTATGASAENAKRQRAVVEALRSRTTPKDQVSTVGYSLAPDERFDSGQRKVIGYIAKSSVVLETSAIDKLGSVIDAAIAAGANLVSDLRFGSSNEDEVRRTALEAAVRRARADASAMAAAAGGSIGGLLELSTSSSAGPVFPSQVTAMARSAETPIAVGEQIVTALVTARWAYVSTLGK